ncbi:hypothetical protein CWI38_0180p0020 [Hamiltosporidium tvaerminnensis]|uniref:Uncharacterized protein n=1 Tax=Hamiltosporidium tvaerminnensis TaxID=1176355 RepID=A0A4Q9M009_9MICR|nr:hypothetical protein CWI38_0180p0020 [Hamiltosporidium tvaerminnensis]
MVVEGNIERKSQILNMKSSVEIGLYNRHYYNTEHKNYISHLEILGPLVICIRVEKYFVRGLIKSVFGINEFKFLKSQNLYKLDEYIFGLKCCTTAFFYEIIESSNIKYEEKKEVAKSSIFGFFNVKKIFGTNKSLKFTNDSSKGNTYSDIMSVSSKFTCEISNNDIEKIRDKISLNRTSFTFDKIANKFIELDEDKKDYLKILDENIEEELIFDIILNESQNKEFIISLLGQKIDKKDFVLLKGTKRIDSLIFETSLINIKANKNEMKLKMAVKEFLEIHKNYYTLLLSSYTDVVLGFYIKNWKLDYQEKNAIFNNCFADFLQLILHESSFLEKIFKKIMEILNLDMENTEKHSLNVDKNYDFLILREEKKLFEIDKNIKEIQSKIENMYFLILKSFDKKNIFLLVDCFYDVLDTELRNVESVYVNFSKEYDIFMNNITTNLKFYNFENIGNIKFTFYEIIKRMTVINSFLCKISEYYGDSLEENFRRMKIINTKYKIITQRINDERDIICMHKRIFEIQHKIINTPGSLINNERRFIKVINCKVYNNIIDYTLFLFNDVIVFTKRIGDEISNLDLDLKNCNLFFIKMVNLKDIRIKNYRKGFFKIIVSELVTDEKHKSMPGFVHTKDLHYNIESCIFVCNDQDIKKQFVQKVYICQNDLRVMASSADLYLSYSDPPIFYFVYDFEKNPKNLECGKYLMIFSDESTEDSVKNHRWMDYLLDSDRSKKIEIKFTICLGKKVKIKIDNFINNEFKEITMKKENFEQNFSVYFKNFLSTVNPSSQNKNETSFSLINDLKVLYDLSLKDKKNKISLKKNVGKDFFVTEKVELFKLLFENIEIRLKLLNSKNLISNVKKSQIKKSNNNSDEYTDTDSFRKTTIIQVLKEPNSELTVNTNDLYNINSIYILEKIQEMISTKVNFDTLNSIDIIVLTSIVSTFFKYSITQIFSYNDILELHKICKNRDTKTSEIFLNSLKGNRKDIFLMFIHHFRDVSKIISTSFFKDLIFFLFGNFIKKEEFDDNYVEILLNIK